jgi:hypothetical protein
MNNRKQNRLLERVLNALALVAIVISVVYIWSVWRKVSYQPEPRAEVKHLFSRIQLGQSKAQVQTVFTSGNYKHLKLHQLPTDNRWLFSTPVEFGAGNWAFYIEYDEQSKVVALRVRTNDSVNEKPREMAPPDKVAPHWEKPFP